MIADIATEDAGTFISTVGSELFPVLSIETNGKPKLLPLIGRKISTGGCVGHGSSPRAQSSEPLKLSVSESRSSQFIYYAVVCVLMFLDSPALQDDGQVGQQPAGAAVCLTECFRTTLQNFLVWPRSEPAPSACGEVWRERRRQEPGLRAALGPAPVPGGHGLSGPRTRSSRLTPTAPGSDRLSTWASSCRGCAGSLSTAGPPAQRWNSRGASATPPWGRAQDLQPAMLELPPPFMGSGADRASPMGAAPCSRAPGPMNCPRLRSVDARCGTGGQLSPPHSMQDLLVNLLLFTLLVCTAFMSCNTHHEGLQLHS
ncbi:uncharacterized protein LOC129138584 [Pan troglodytes]|uniref:uncharacterized protein LOC129138584 n=1 Tax=Pan troglodytes TaxID=9598 RepID=UPI0023F2C57A|nr:uncharacterized protein LOC129138584 [Pan troglodytes]